MNIDWFTFVAQIINFLILVALLRWLLYGPIVRAMSRREERIARRLEEASQKQREAEATIELYEQKRRELDQQREELLEKVRQEVAQERQKLLAQARKEVKQKREQWQEEYERERKELMADLRWEVGKLSLELAQHTLRQLADEELEKQMLEVFASRFQLLNDDQRSEIGRHLGPEAKVVMRTTFDLSETWRERLGQLLRDNFGYDDQITFERSSDLICGLELDLGGYSFGWNIMEFLRNIELDFLDRVKSVSWN